MCGTSSGVLEQLRRNFADMLTCCHADIVMARCHADTLPCRQATMLIWCGLSCRYSNIMLSLCEAKLQTGCSADVQSLLTC